jgi:lipoyl-dependent peroxiredoxin
MPKRAANARWEGDLAGGNGTMELGGGAWSGPYSAKSRFEEGDGTNPEELIAAAHAGCFSMALSAALTKAGKPPRRIQTTAAVHLEQAEGGFRIPRIDLQTEAEVPGIDEAEFHRQADDAKKNCPVSKVLAGAEITLNAKLLKA